MIFPQTSSRLFVGEQPTEYRGFYRFFERLFFRPFLDFDDFGFAHLDLSSIAQALVALFASASRACACFRGAGALDETLKGVVNIKCWRTYMTREINRRPLVKVAKPDRARVVFCGGHYAGVAALSAFTEGWNCCSAICDVVCVIPDRKDQANAKGSLWEKDDSDWRIKLVEELAGEHNLRIAKLDLYPGEKFNHQLLEILKETKANAILSSTFRGIFRQEVLDFVDGRAFNIHPTGIAEDEEGFPLIEWPQPLFEGKQAFDLMFELHEKFQREEKPKGHKKLLDCQSMEWVIHRIAPPPFVDRGRFIGASQYPCKIPVEVQLGLDTQTRFNGAQDACAAHIPQLLHEFAHHLFANDPERPWKDPRLDASLRRHPRRSSA